MTVSVRLRGTLARMRALLDVAEHQASPAPRVAYVRRLESMIDEVWDLYVETLAGPSYAIELDRPSPVEREIAALRARVRRLADALAVEAVSRDAVDAQHAVRLPPR